MSHNVASPLFLFGSPVTSLSQIYSRHILQARHSFTNLTSLPRSHTWGQLWTTAVHTHLANLPPLLPKSPCSVHQLRPPDMAHTNSNLTTPFVTTRTLSNLLLTTGTSCFPSFPAPHAATTPTVLASFDPLRASNQKGFILQGDSRGPIRLMSGLPHSLHSQCHCHTLSERWLNCIHITPNIQHWLTAHWESKGILLDSYSP